MYDNELLVEFESIIDLDLAMYKFIKDKYSNSDYVDQKFINEQDERAIIYTLLNRKHINPLEIIMPGLETTNLYFDNTISLLFGIIIVSKFGLRFLIKSSSNFDLHHTVIDTDDALFKNVIINPNVSYAVAYFNNSS